jgi:excinuclease UvrABC helicase subunit UvrB
MVMYKDEVVALMTNAVNEMNRRRAIQMGIHSIGIEESIQDMQDELNKVNGMLYDTLVDNGIIRN